MVAIMALLQRIVSCTPLVGLLTCLERHPQESYNAESQAVPKPVGEHVRNQGRLVDFMDPIQETLCTVVVVASDDCHWCHKLVKGWGAALTATADSAAAVTSVLWIVTSRDDDARLPQELAGQNIPMISVRGTIRTAEKIAGMIGTPNTLLVDREGIVREAIAGNNLPTRGSLGKWCKA